jgi:DNA-binding transcriptional ArsR family regulator
MSEWIPTGAGEPADELAVDDLGLIDEVTHAVRGKLFRRLKTPRSAAELAQLLDVPVTRLYHHLNRLEARGLIRVVATRRAGAVTERRYQVVAKSLRLDESVIPSLPPAELARAAGALFDGAKLGLQRAIESGQLTTPAGGEQSLLSFNEITLTAAQRAELITRLKALIDEFDALGDEDDRAGDDAQIGERFTLFAAAFAVVE